MNGTKVVGITVLATTILLTINGVFADTPSARLEEKTQTTSQNSEIRIILLFHAKDASLEEKLSSALSSWHQSDHKRERKLKFIFLEHLSDEDKELVNKYSLGELASAIITSSEGKPLAASLLSINDATSLTQIIQEAEKVEKFRLEVKQLKSRGSPETAEIIDRFLATVPSQYWLPHYEEEIRLLLDSSRSGPLFEKYTALSADYDRQKQVGDFLKKVYSQVGKTDPPLEEFLQVFKNELDIAKLSPEARQLAEMHRFRYLAQARKYDQALECLDSAEKAAPTTKLAKNIEKFRERIKKAQLASSTDPTSPPTNPPPAGKDGAGE